MMKESGKTFTIYINSIDIQWIKKLVIQNIKFNLAFRNQYTLLMKGKLSLLNPLTQAQKTGGSGFYSSIQFLCTLTGMIQSKLF